MVIVMITSIIICIATIWITIIVTNKAYAFKHSVDPMDQVPKELTEYEYEYEDRFKKAESK
ncbi:YtzI protein [Neobacillus notoginsengisoli]|nr:YtzI protein [Neobacillus notoginsengisoli]